MQSRTFSRSEKNIILAIMVLGSIFPGYSQSSVNVAIPVIGQELGLNAIWMSWITTSFALASTCLLIPLGKIADMYGRKKIFLLGVIAFTAASLVAPFSTSAVTLISVRVLQGIGASIINLNTISIASSVFPASERGRAIGFIVAAVYLGLSTGPFFGGILTESFGWRSVFWSNVPLGLAVIILMLWKFKGEWKQAQQGKFDIVGSTIFALALIALTYGCSQLPAAAGLWLVLAGVMSVGLFIWWETRVKNPVLQLRLFRHNTLYTFSNLAALVNYSGTASISILMVLYLQFIKGFNPFTAGLVMITMPAVQAIVSTFAGRLSDKVEPRFIVSLGMTLDAGGLLFLGFLGFGTGLPHLIAILSIIGLGFGLFSSPNSNAIMGAVEPEYYGIASATQATMRQFGGIISLALATFMIALFMGKADIIPENYPYLLQSIRTAFYICSGLGFCGIFFSLARGKVRKELPQPQKA